MVALTHWLCFLFFWRELIFYFWPPVSIICFGGFLAWVNFLIAGDMPMSLQFWKDNFPSLFQINDPFPQHLLCLGCLRMSVRIGGLQFWFSLQVQLWLHVYVCTIHFKVHWRMCKRLGLCRLILAQPLKGQPSGNCLKLCSVGIRVSFLSIISPFLTNRLQHLILFFGCWSKLVNVISGVPQGSVLGLILILFILEAQNFLYRLFIWEVMNKQD